MEELFDNIYVLAVYGFVIYTAVLFVMEKDEYDDVNKHFNLTKYLIRNWDNWLLSVILVPIMATKAVDIWGAIISIWDKTWPFYDLYYLGVGAVVEALYTGIKWIKNKRKKLTSLN